MQRKRMFCTWTGTLEGWKKNQEHQREQAKKKREQECEEYDMRRVMERHNIKSLPSA